MARFCHRKKALRPASLPKSILNWTWQLRKLSMSLPTSRSMSSRCGMSWNIWNIWMKPGNTETYSERPGHTHYSCVPTLLHSMPKIQRNVGCLRCSPTLVAFQSLRHAAVWSQTRLYSLRTASDAFDAFYVSMLSEKYRKSAFPFIKGLITSGSMDCFTGQERPEQFHDLCIQKKIRNYESEVGQSFRYAIHYPCISTMLVLLLLGMVVFLLWPPTIFCIRTWEYQLFRSSQRRHERSRSHPLPKQLEEEPLWKQATYISKAQALKEQTEAMGTDPAEFLGYNPFIGSIEIKLNAAYANSDSLSWIQENCWTIKSHWSKLSAGPDWYHQPEHTQNQHVPVRAGCFAHPHFICIDQQYHTTDHLLQTFSDSPWNW